jgi:hypothetical protein
MNQETNMLKSISAALIAVSLLAAPAMAASTAKTGTAPIAKSVASAVKAKPSVLNANAKVSRHHHRYHRHHRFHKKMSATKSNKVSKVTIKQGGAATKRG